MSNEWAKISSRGVDTEIEEKKLAVSTTTAGPGAERRHEKKKKQVSNQAQFSRVV